MEQIKDTNSRGDTVVTPPLTRQQLGPIHLDVQDYLNFSQFLKENIPGLQSTEPTLLDLQIKSGKTVSTTASLVRKSGYYIVPFNGKFYYYKIGPLVPKGEYLFEMTPKFPPVLREGFVILDKVAYYVTYKDLQRGIVRKSRKLKLRLGTITYDDFITGNTAPAEPKRKNDTISGSKNSEQTGTNEIDSEKVNVETQPIQPVLQKVEKETSDFSLDRFFVGNQNKRTTKGDAKLEELATIDNAFEKEIGALLSHSFEKEGSSWEEWEVEKGI